MRFDNRKMERMYLENLGFAITKSIINSGFKIHSLNKVGENTAHNQ